jgi:predicted O-methyltransferase YrrM
VSSSVALLKLPVVGPVLLKAYRWREAQRYLSGRKSLVRRWLWSSNETTNLTYDLGPENLAYLADFLAHVTKQPVEQVEQWMKELQSDQDLVKHIQAKTDVSEKAMMSDRTPRYHKRIGWYVLVRALKPKVVIETGIDKGLGSVVLCAALLRNQQEGHEGKYYGTDINPLAGFLLADRYATVGKILYGDSIESLKTITEPIDFFINDSDHSAEYEGREYQTIKDKLSPDAVVIGDNAHVTLELHKFARETKRTCLVFYEKPHDHWYPGGAIGVAYRG